MPKIQGIKVLYQKNGKIFDYQFGKVSPAITVSNITANQLSLNVAKYYGINYKDDTYLINGLLQESVRLMIGEKCCPIIFNTKADKTSKYLPIEEQNKRYGVAIRVLDFIWITEGSMYLDIGSYIL